MSNETTPTALGMDPWQILDELYDRALTRFLQSSEFDYRDYLDDEELAEHAAAEEAELAHTGSAAATVAREARNTVRGKVVIEVLGGVAEVTSQPNDIVVEIIDHDNENAKEQNE